MSQDLVNLAFGHVVATVEPLTRFDRKSLRLESGRARVVNGRASWRYTATFANEPSEGRGHQPSSARRVDGPSELASAASHAEAAGLNALPQRLHAWAGANHHNDRALNASDCFDGPVVFGWERACHRCHGEGRLKCGGCENGYLPCTTCARSGEEDCPDCRGVMRNLVGMASRGTVECRGCNGSGKHNNARCATCNGSGWIVCPRCQRRKKITCRSCGGPGKHPHKPCGATGWLTCDVCNGMRYLHSLRTVSCSVSNQFGVHVVDANREVVATIGGRDLANLRAIARVLQQPPSIGGRTLERVYAFETPIVEMTVGAADAKVSLCAFGDKAAIFDYKGLVTHLLAADLKALKGSVEKTPLRLWGDTTHLTAATKQFLESEVNVTIDNPDHLHKRIVDAAYVQQAKSLIRSALARVFGARFGPVLLATTVLPAMFLVAGHFGGAWTAIGGWANVPVVLAALVPLALLERQARVEMRRAFDGGAASGQNGPGHVADRLLDKYRITWIGRGAALAGALVLLGAAKTLVVHLTTP